MAVLTRDQEFLREMSDEELERLDGITEVRTLAAGDVVVRQGLLPEAVFVLLEGTVRVTAIMAEADDLVQQEEEVLVHLKPGELFGEISFITGDAPNLSVICEEPSRVAAIDRLALHQLISTDASICRKLLFAFTRTLVARLRNTGRDLVLTRYFLRSR